jgi:protein TonB
MAIIKTKKADLISKYKTVFEISLIVVLIILIMAFRFFPDLKIKKIKQDPPQDIFSVEDILQTKQEKRPLPPPKPPIPIEAPSSEVLENIEIGSTEIDERQQIYEAPQPPKEHKFTEDNFFLPVAEIMPEPIGGISAIQQKVFYPEIAKRVGVEGKVYVLAFVDETGNVIDAKITKGIGAGCDEAALDAVINTKFKPGKQRDKPVKVQITIPIVFRLQ